MGYPFAGCGSAATEQNQPAHGVERTAVAPLGRLNPR